MRSAKASTRDQSWKYVRLRIGQLKASVEDLVSLLEHPDAGSLGVASRLELVLGKFDFVLGQLAALDDESEPDIKQAKGEFQLILANSRGALAKVTALVGATNPQPDFSLTNDNLEIKHGRW